MIIGDMMLANEVITPNGNQTLLTVPNNIFPVLSVPAYITFGTAIVLSGMDFEKPHELTIEIQELDNEETTSTIFQQRIDQTAPQDDPHPSLSASLSLRNVIINKLGYHKVMVKLDGTVVTDSIINIIKATQNRWEYGR